MFLGFFFKRNTAPSDPLPFHLKPHLSFHLLVFPHRIKNIEVWFVQHVTSSSSLTYVLAIINNFLIHVHTSITNPLMKTKVPILYNFTPVITLCMRICLIMACKYPGSVISETQGQRILV